MTDTDNPEVILNNALEQFPTIYKETVKGTLHFTWGIVEQEDNYYIVCPKLKAYQHVPKNKTDLDTLKKIVQEKACTWTEELLDKLHIKANLTRIEITDLIPAITPNNL